MNQYKPQTACLWMLVLIGSALAPIQARAQNDLRSLSVPYSSANPTTIGSGIDVDLINQQRFTCLDIPTGAVTFFDGPGAIRTDASIELVSDYKSLSKTLNLDVDYKSKGDVNFAAIKAGGSVEFSSKYEDFAKDESRSLAIVLKASSDFGRRGLSDYALKKEFAELLTSGKFGAFRERCGTHTVVAQQNMAMIAIVIALSDLSASSKRSLEASYKSNINASGTINGVGLSGNVDKTIAWKSFVEAAKKVGRMNVQWASVGGAGITDALKVMTIPDPAKIDAVLKTLNEAGATLTQPNSAPARFLLVSNSVFGLKTPVSDISKLDTINSFYLQLVRVDYALKRVDGYKDTFPSLYQAEYAQSKSILELRSYRKQLVEAIENCVLRDNCGYTPPASLAVLFLEDVILPDSLKLQCSYQRFDSKDGKVRLNVLNDAAVILRGNARLTDYIGLQNAFLGRVEPETIPPRKVYSTWQAFSASQPAADKTVRILAQLDNQKFGPEVSIGDSTVIVTNESDMIKLMNSMLNSIYLVNMQAKSGVFIQNSVGPPFGGDCPLKMPVR